MLEKGFLNEKSKRKTSKNPKTQLIGTLMLFAGAIIVVIGFINILSDFQNVGILMRRWTPFLILGIILAFAGFIVMRIRKK